MPTPSIQTLINDAQQVLNLDSISAVRSVVAVSLANANTGTPLNPNLTTQQLWNEFYQVVTRSKSDIESIIANQLMKFLYSPPAPGGVGANKQVIFNDGGALAGAANLYWDKANNRVGIGTASPQTTLDSAGTVTISGGTGAARRLNFDASGVYLNYIESAGTAGAGYMVFAAGNSEVYRIATGGTSTWSVGGSTAMTLNSTGLGVGVSPSYKLDIFGTVRVGTANPVVRLETGTNTGFIDYNDTRLQLHAGPLPMYFVAGNTLKMTLDAAGNLGIGVTPSAWGSNYTAVELTKGASIFGAKNVPYTIVGANVYNDATNEKYAVSPNTAATKYQQTGGVHSWHNAVAGAINTAIGFTQAMTLDASGRLLVGPTSANTSGGVLQLSSGITFPATQVASSDANTLDDYEEGTWTGTLKGSVSDPTTPVTATGVYTKVGRLVTCSIGYSNVNTTGASGNVTIDGLPFSGAASVAGSVITFDMFTVSTTLAVWNVGTSLAFYVSGAFTPATFSAGPSRSVNVTISYYV